MQALEIKQTLNKLMQVIEDYLLANDHAQTAVLNYRPAHLLKEDLNLEIGASGIPLNDLFADIELYLKNSVRTSHPLYFNQLNGGLQLPSFIGDIISALSNTTMATYEVSPVASLMEKELIKKVNYAIGWEMGEGIMTSGGSNSNLQALLCARQKFFPEFKAEGLSNAKLAVFVSSQAHYSFGKALNILGFGTSNLFLVEADEQGRMIPEALKSAISGARIKGYLPLFIGATSGTTVYGAFDPLQAIAKIAREENLWLHVDGAWGGIVLFSEKYRQLIAGVDRADSFCWDAHKTLGAPLMSSFFTTKHKGILKDTNGLETGGEYIFHGYADEVLDSGTQSLQCGRRVDALKVWLLWKFYGDQGLDDFIDSRFALAKYATETIINHPELELLHQPEYLNICFIVKNFDTKELRKKLIQEGKTMVNYSHGPNGERFFRLVVHNSQTSKESLDQFFNLLTNQN